MGIFDSIKKMISGKEFGEFSWIKINEVNSDNVKDIHYIFEENDSIGKEKSYIVLWYDYDKDFLKTSGTKAEILKNFKIKEKDFKLSKFYNYKDLI